MPEYDSCDILIAIAAYFPVYKRSFFKLNNPEFHSFFYEKSKEYPELFKSFNFRNDSAYFPFSGELDHARTTMSFCGLLQSFGMDFNPHEFTPKCRIRFENEVKKIFSTEDLSKLEQISIEFQNKFGVEHL